MKYHIFLSYIRSDFEDMQIIRQELENAGLTVWVDQEIRSGSEWPLEIEQALRNAGCMVVILSPETVSSKWVRREIHLAEKLGLRIFYLLVKGQETDIVALEISSSQIDNIQDKKQRPVKIGKIVKTIRDHLGIQPINPQPTKKPALHVKTGQSGISNELLQQPLSNRGCNFFARLHNSWMKFSIEIRVAIILALITGIIVPIGIGVFTSLPQEQRDHILHQLGIVVASPIPSISTLTPIPTQTPAPSPTVPPPLQIHSISKPSPLGDIWTIQRVAGRPDYEEKEYLVVYEAQSPNFINGAQTNEPIAKVLVVRKTDDFLYVQVILKHPTVMIETGNIVDNRLNNLNIDTLIPAYTGAIGYFVRLDTGYVYITSGEVKVSVGDILIMLAPFQPENEITEYFRASPRMRAIEVGEQGRGIKVELLDGATQLPENGTLVVLANPPTPTTPPTETATTPAPTPTCCVTPTAIPTATPLPGWVWSQLSNGQWFQIQVNAVSSEDYLEFAQSNLYLTKLSGKGVEPAILITPDANQVYANVNWYAADLYCREWLPAQYPLASYTYRLPTRTELNAGLLAGAQAYPTQMEILNSSQQINAPDVVLYDLSGIPVPTTAIDAQTTQHIFRCIGIP